MACSKDALAIESTNTFPWFLHGPPRLNEQETLDANKQEVVGANQQWANGANMQGAPEVNKQEVIGANQQGAPEVSKHEIVRANEQRPNGVSEQGAVGANRHGAVGAYNKHRANWANKQGAVGTNINKGVGDTNAIQRQPYQKWQYLHSGYQNSGYQRKKPKATQPTVPVEVSTSQSLKDAIDHSKGVFEGKANYLADLIKQKEKLQKDLNSLIADPQSLEAKGPAQEMAQMKIDLKKIVSPVQEAIDKTAVIQKSVKAMSIDSDKLQEAYITLNRFG